MYESREHGRHSSASHVHGHSGSRLSARAAAPSASEPVLRALANLLVGLTTARDCSGGIWSNTFLAGAVPGAGPGLGSSIPGAVPVPSVSAGASALGGVPPVRGSSTTGLSGMGDLHWSCPARSGLTSVRPLGGSPARTRPVLGGALFLLPALLARFPHLLPPRLLLWERSAPLPLERGSQPGVRVPLGVHERSFGGYVTGFSKYFSFEQLQTCLQKVAYMCCTRCVVQ